MRASPEIVERISSSAISEIISGKISSWISGGIFVKIAEEMSGVTPFKEIKWEAFGTILLEISARIPKQI